MASGQQSSGSMNASSATTATVDGVPAASERTTRDSIPLRSATRRPVLIHDPRAAVDASSHHEDEQASYVRRLRSEEAFHREQVSVTLGLGPATAGRWRVPTAEADGDVRGGRRPDVGGSSSIPRSEDNNSNRDANGDNNKIAAPNSPASALATEAGKEEEGGRGGAEGGGGGRSEQLPIAASPSSSSSSPHAQKSMLDVMCDVASSISDIPVMATPSADDAAVAEKAEIVETAENAGMVAAANDDATVDTSAIAAGDDNSGGASSLSPQPSLSEHSQKKQKTSSSSPSRRQPEEEGESSSSTAKKRREIDTADSAEVDEEAAGHYGSVVPTPGSFRTPMQQQQQNHYHMMSRNPQAYSQQLLVPQYQKHRDNDNDDGRPPPASGFFVPAVAHKPVAYPPFRQGEYPMAMATSPRGLIHPQQQAMMAAAMAHHPWQHSQQMMMMTPGHMMMPPAGVFSHGYVQLQQYQLMVPQQQQLMMSHMNALPPGHLPDQQQHARTSPLASNHPPSSFPDDVAHHPGGGWARPQPQHVPHQAYGNTPSSFLHPVKHQAFPSQDQHQHDNVEVDADVASRGQQHQQRRQQLADMPSLHAAAGKSPHPAIPSQNRPSHCDGYADRKPNRSNAPVFVHQPAFRESPAAAQRPESSPESPTLPPSPSWKRRGHPPEDDNSDSRKPNGSNAPVVVHQPACHYK